jgi:endonuclease YncB( thermonuclease family)
LSYQQVNIKRRKQIMAAFMSLIFLTTGVKFFMPLANAGSLKGAVVKISDGDTITVLVGRERLKVRLQGIDAPEFSQPFGKASTKYLTDRVAGKSVEIISNKQDKYGRAIGKVLLDGQDINLEMVKQGLAWHYKYYQKDQLAADRKQYAKAEVDARAQRKGLWSDKSSVPPWEYRRSNKKKKKINVTQQN